MMTYSEFIEWCQGFLSWKLRYKLLGIFVLVSLVAFSFGMLPFKSQNPVLNDVFKSDVELKNASFEVDTGASQDVNVIKLPNNATGNYHSRTQMDEVQIKLKPGSRSAIGGIIKSDEEK